MAFKTVDQFNKERGYDNYFTLRNDKEYADVIFLYRGTSDVLVAEAHYIKSENYSGYVHCCGRGCPACGKGIPVRNKLFIPMYNLTTNKIEFWDRNMSFENQLNQEVFMRYPNPSDYVFRITRNGQPRDVNTTYQIQVVGKNTTMPYDMILNKFHTSVPEVYNLIIREVGIGELNSMLNPATTATNPQNITSSYSTELPSYQVTPRPAYNPSADMTSSSVDSIEDSADDNDVPFDIASDSDDDDLPSPDFD